MGTSEPACRRHSFLTFVLYPSVIRFPFRRTHSRTHLPALCLCDILCHVFSYVCATIRSPPHEVTLDVAQDDKETRKNEARSAELAATRKSNNQQIIPTRKIDDVSIDSCFRALHGLLLRFTAAGLCLLNIRQYGGRRKCV